jgi:hypothetical protein
MESDVNAHYRSKQYAQLVAMTWADPEFKQRLMTDPTAVLKEQGFELPSGVEVRVVENSDKVLHVPVQAGTEVRPVVNTVDVVYFPLPAKPTEISDEQLDVAGYTMLACCTCCSGCSAICYQVSCTVY